MFKYVRISVTLLVMTILLIVGCESVDIDPGSPVPTPERALQQEPSYDVELVIGRQASLTDIYVAYAAEASECDDNPLVFDTRPDNHNSITLMPILGEGDWDKLTSPNGSFPGFDVEVLNEHGCLKAKPGEVYWDLHAVILECGATNIHPQTYDLDGNKASDILLVLSYPGAPALDAAFDPRYYSVGVYGWTSENGDLAWAYGPESHMDAGGKGPYTVWANRDPESWPNSTIGSDGLDDIGWVDDHCEVSPIFQRKVKSGYVPPIPTDGYELINYDENGNVIGTIQFSAGTPPTDVRILGLRYKGVDVGWVEWAVPQ